MRWKLAERLGIYTDVNGAIYNKALTDAQVKSGAEIESLKALAELAAEYRIDSTKHNYCVIRTLHGTQIDDRCSICKAYDALSGPREGEQDGKAD